MVILIIILIIIRILVLVWDPWPMATLIIVPVVILILFLIFILIISINLCPNVQLPNVKLFALVKCGYGLFLVPLGCTRNVPCLWADIGTWH